MYSDNVMFNMDFMLPDVDDVYFNVYKVESGDSLYQIAKKYNINPKLLASLNGLNFDDYIYPNQEILIPKSSYSYYITTDGDTLSSVSDIFKISKEELLKQNETIYLLKDQILVNKRR